MYVHSIFTKYISIDFQKHSFENFYTEDAGCCVTTGIPVKFGTAHGASRPVVGSAKRIEAYGSRGVSRPSLAIGNS